MQEFKEERKGENKNIELSRFFDFLRIKHMSFIRQGGKRHQEDALLYKEYNYSWGRFTRVYIVADGHGEGNGMFASNFVRDYCGSFFDATNLTNHTIEQISVLLKQLNRDAHRSLRDAFVTKFGCECNGNVPVSAQSNDCIRGGTTLTIFIIIGNSDGSKNLISSNVGDSVGIMLDLNAAEPEKLTEDHDAMNKSEYDRILALPIKEKLIAKYSKQVGYEPFDSADLPDVFTATGEMDARYVRNPWGNRLVPSDVDYNPGTYWVTRRGVRYTQQIAMSRAIGDFGAHKYGMTEEPSINYKGFPPNSSPSFACVASDGVWDVIGTKAICQKFFNELVDECVTKKLDESACNQLFQDSVDKATASSFGMKGCDDACGFLFKI